MSAKDDDMNDAESAKKNIENAKTKTYKIVDESKMKTAEDLPFHKILKIWRDECPGTEFNDVVLKVAIKYSDQQLAAYKSSIDKEFIQWLYFRMITVYGENSDYDYMIKFRKLIDQL